MQAQLNRRSRAPISCEGARTSAEGVCALLLDHGSLHDLSSPANRIAALTQLILYKYHDVLDAEGEVLFSHLQESVGQLQKLMTSLRTYVMILGSPGDPRSCNAEDLLSAALISISDDVRQSEAIVTSDPLPEVACDPTQIIHLFTSLIGNSIKFRRDRAPKIHVSSFSEDREWVVSVQDDGIGIDPRHGDQVFRIFRRINGEAYPGVGVGLAIARQIVDRHGGRIWFESEPGHGSRFSFSLPKAA